MGREETDVTLKPWLFRVALNRCFDELRRKKRQRAHLFSELESVREDEEMLILTALPDATPLPEEWAERHDEQRSLHTAIKALPITYRAVVWLRYAEDLSFPEIGRRLQIPSGTAKTAYHRACVKLRNILSLAREEMLSQPVH